MTAPTLYDSLLPHQQRALLEKYYDVNVCEDYWTEYVIDDIKRAGEILGITIDDVSWSIHSGYDGFRFKGTYRHEQLAHLFILHEYPQDTDLHKLAYHLHFAHPRPYTISATVRIGWNRYDNPNNTDIDCELCSPYHYADRYTSRDLSPEDIPDWDERTDQIETALRDFMRWAFKQIQAEYDYQTSDEAIIDFINNNLTLEDIELQEAA